MAHHEHLLDQLHHTVQRLAEAVDDVPQVARALRHFAAGLPAYDAPRPPAGLTLRDAPLRPLLYSALAIGALDARSFDRGMLVGTRAERMVTARGRGRRYSPPGVTSPSPSKSTPGAGGSDGGSSGGLAAP